MYDEIIYRSARVCQYALVPGLDRGVVVAGWRLFVQSSADVDGGTCFPGGCPHGICEDFYVCAIKSSCDVLRLSVLVLCRVDAIAGFPVAVGFISDLPVFCSAVVVANPVGCQVGGG